MNLFDVGILEHIIMSRSVMIAVQLCDEMDFVHVLLAHHQKSGRHKSIVDFCDVFGAHHQVTKALQPCDEMNFFDVILARHQKSGSHKSIAAVRLN